MINYLKLRYTDAWTRLRAIAHASISVALVTYAVHQFGMFGYAALGAGIIVEIIQAKTDKDYDVRDGICDCFEWIAGASLAILAMNLF